MRDDCSVARSNGRIDGCARFGKGAHLVRLDQDGVADVALDALGQNRRLRHEKVVADKLHPPAQRARQGFPAVPVVLGHAVLDAHDRVAVRKFREPAGEVGRVESAVFGFQAVQAVGIQFAGSHVQTQEKVPGHAEAGLLYRFDQRLQRHFVGRQIGRESTFVAHRRRPAGLPQDALQDMIDLDSPAQRFVKVAGSHRQDHEFLDVQAIVGMRATVEDVHHRRGHRGRPGAKSAVERLALRGRGGPGGGQGNGQDRVGPEPRPVGGAVQRDHSGVKLVLALAVGAEKGLADLAVDMAHGRLDAAPAKAAGIPVAQLDRFARAGGGPRGHCRPAPGSAAQRHLGLQRGVAARIENLARVYVSYCRHDPSASGRDFTRWSSSSRDSISSRTR